MPTGFSLARFLTGCVAAVILACTLPLSTAAAPAIGLRITPLVKTLTLTQGQTYNGFIEVTEMLGTSQDLYPLARDFTPSSSPGAPIFLEVTPVGFPTELASWISFSTNTFTLAANSVGQVPFTITVPANAQVGDHYAGIFASSFPQFLGAGNGVNVVGRIGALHIVTVLPAPPPPTPTPSPTSSSPSVSPTPSGTTTSPIPTPTPTATITQPLPSPSAPSPQPSAPSSPASQIVISGAITNFRVDDVSDEPSQFALIITFENTGNVHFKPVGTMLITNLTDNSVLSLTLNDEGALVLGGTSRDFIKYIEKQKLPPGQYTVRIDFSLVPPVGLPVIVSKSFSLTILPTGQTVVTPIPPTPLLQVIRNVAGDATRSLLLPLTSLLMLVTIGTLGLLAGAIGVGSFSLASFFALTSNILTLMTAFWHQLLEFTSLRRKRLPWGTVFAVGTDMPIELTMVRLFNDQGKLLETRVTDRAGRFGFVPDPGKYLLEAVKQDYVMQTSGVSSRRFDPIFDGKPISVPDRQHVINTNIALGLQANRRHINLIFLLRRLHRPVLVLSLALSIWNVIIVPSVFTAVVFGIAMVILIGEWLLFEPRYFGVVRDKKTRKPLKGIVLRLLETEYQRVVATQVTDEFGRYSFLVRPGKYRLTCVSPGWQAPQWLTTKELINVTEKEGRIINPHIDLIRQESTAVPVAASAKTE